MLASSLQSSHGGERSEQDASIFAPAKTALGKSIESIESIAQVATDSGILLSSAVYDSGLLRSTCSREMRSRTMITFARKGRWEGDAGMKQLLAEASAPKYQMSMSRRR